MAHDKKLRCFTVGLFIGLLILPLSPAQAQWAVIDGANLKVQVARRIEEASRWVTTVQHYTEIYTKAVEQLTTLRGVLKTVDTQLFKNQQAALLANDLARVISDTQKLKRQLEGLLRYQIRFLKSIDDRLEQGIFDPDADMRDLQNYLLYAMGRDARQTVDQMMKAARADSELAGWIAEREKLSVQLSSLSKSLKKNEALLDKEMSSSTADQFNIQHLNELIVQQKKEGDELYRQFKELTAKIEKRMKEWGLRLSDMENFARKIDANNQMWGEMTKTQASMQKTMNDLFFNSPQSTQ